MREFRVLTLTAERVFDPDYIDEDDWDATDIGAEFVAVFINGVEVWRPKTPEYIEDPADVAVEFFEKLGKLID